MVCSSASEVATPSRPSPSTLASLPPHARTPRFVSYVLSAFPLILISADGLLRQFSNLEQFDFLRGQRDSLRCVHLPLYPRPQLTIRRLGGRGRQGLQYERHRRRAGYGSHQGERWHEAQLHSLCSLRHHHRQECVPLCFYLTEILTPNSVKTGRWPGVVVAFITMSDVKDEIDWEFPGAKTTEGQSNFFWQGFIRTSPPSQEPIIC